MSSPSHLHITVNGGTGDDNIHLGGDHPTLFFPRPEFLPEAPAGPPAYVRSEDQVLFRLPRTGAVVFSIHTYIVPLESLPAEARAALGPAGVRQGSGLSD